MYRAFLRCTTSLVQDPEAAGFVHLPRKSPPSHLNAAAPWVPEAPQEHEVLGESPSRSMKMMVQIMAVAIEQNYGFDANDILASAHEHEGGYLIVFCSANTDDNEEVDGYSDPDFHEAASAFLSDLKGINISKGVNIDPESLCLTVRKQIDLFNLLEDYRTDPEFILPCLDDVGIVPEKVHQDVLDQFYKESVLLNAATSRERCANEETAAHLFQNIAPQAYISKTQYEAGMMNSYLAHLPFSMDHLAKIIEQEEGTKPSFDRPASLILGGYQ